MYIKKMSCGAFLCFLFMHSNRSSLEKSRSSASTSCTSPAASHAGSLMEVAAEALGI